MGNGTTTHAHNSATPSTVAGNATGIIVIASSNPRPRILVRIVT